LIAGVRFPEKTDAGRNGAGLHGGRSLYGYPRGYPYAVPQGDDAPRSSENQPETTFAGWRFRIEKSPLQCAINIINATMPTTYDPTDCPVSCCRLLMLAEDVLTVPGSILALVGVA